MLLVFLPLCSSRPQRWLEWFYEFRFGFVCRRITNYSSNSYGIHKTGTSVTTDCIHTILLPTFIHGTLSLGLENRYGKDRAYHIAMLRAHRGEIGPAFDWLQKAERQNSTSLTYIAVEPLFRSLHGASRWLPFLQGIGMAPGQLAAIEFNVSLPDRKL